ncbi:MAG: prepilin-type N-terminal cleavage/methylation domain-containing protein [Pseudomonadota bacterium]
MKPWRNPGAPTPDSAPLHPGYNGPAAVANRTKGFTLIELVVTIVVLAIGVTGILAVYIQTVARSADPMLQQQAVLIAEAYMDEILGKAFADPDGSEIGESRSTWDDVDDYAAIVSAAPAAASGTAIADLADYRVTVTVTPEAVGGVAASDARNITVSVTHAQDAGVRADLVGYRFRDS